MIEGVKITPLKTIADDRGKIMHMLRSDAEHFSKFGEVYFSFVNNGVIKAWHYHKEMTINYAVPVGKIDFVLYDSREESSTFGETQVITMSPEDYFLVTVPPRVWNGFKGLSTEPAMVVNCTDIPHRGDEIERLDFNTDKIPFKWD
ncbi:dTDP-D-glucose 4,6-dehydratase [Halobacteriovorax marinus SJ]|uniref:dTDP-4-dehydrorhamnose 3,5-epimerase n=1 Tax=Halobacteriovorax marinus (strain ATCC BAA-682 / DSM 15412 / SJ) TaxID=862908 RepID=E1X3V0_HALMS|nr:dTDP-4-dehydrorhamnose 3,5-epimerase family protein [Halobacteriovorax marinus]CBW25290.1 dTDP-D-glucose 4,6-dehydratase [Halobacteriovorax marinus SJ]